MRTGDTPADVRRRFPAHPPDILITTPESLFLLLTSRAREALAYVDTVIVDEVHSVVATKRGAHLALSLERLDELLERPARRIGLSATVRPLDEVARFLGGPRPVTVVAPPWRRPSTCRWSCRSRTWRPSGRPPTTRRPGRPRACPTAPRSGPTSTSGWSS